MLNETCKISVIIPTYNRSTNLGFTIRSLLQQNIDKSEFEIVIADDGSFDNTFQDLRKYEDLVNIKYAYQVDKGYRPASARNLGIGIASGAICLFIDSGIILKQNCLQSHIACHLNHRNEVAIIGYTYGYMQHGESEEELASLVDPNDADRSIARLIEKGKFLDIREKIYRKYGDRIGELNAAWSLFWGGHLSVKRDTLFDVGLFDDKYDGNWGCEDNDLGYRLLKADRELFFCREAAVLHLPHGTNLDQKKKEGYENCKYFNNKFQTFETQLFFDYYLKEITGDEVIDFNELIVNAGQPAAAER